MKIPSLSTGSCNTRLVPRLLILCGILLITLLVVAPAKAEGILAAPVRVVKTEIHAEGEKAEVCLIFTAPLPVSFGTSLEKLLVFEALGKRIKPEHRISGSSLCLFPLMHRTAYRLKIEAMHRPNGELLSPLYVNSFYIAPRAPLLAFTPQQPPANPADARVTLRSVNVPHANLTLYRITGLPEEARAWSLRAQTLIAPSEAALFAQSKGEKIWEGGLNFDGSADATQDQTFTLREKIPSLRVGLYLVTAEAPSADPVSSKKQKHQGLAPFAVSWVIPADLLLTAVRDDSGVSVFSAAPAASSAPLPPDLTLALTNKDGEILSADAQADPSGITRLPFPPNLKTPADMTTVIATDKTGRVAFADVTSIPVPRGGQTQNPVPTEPSRLTLSTPIKHLGREGPFSLALTAVTFPQSPRPLTGGRVFWTWERRMPEALGQTGYLFGMPTAILGSPLPVGSFLTDLAGESTLRLIPPAPPPEPGLYQASLQAIPDPQTGIAPSVPLTIPLDLTQPLVGIKPLALHARFSQNGLARFALIALGEDNAPRDLSDLSWQVFEEGRSFSWYQESGRWHDRPEETLRPIGGGDLSIRRERPSVLEIPVTAGNYRLEIQGADGEPLAETSFSAGWDAAPVPPDLLPLSINLPPALQMGREATATVLLSEAGLVRAYIADHKIRKSFQAFASKGAFSLTFTPAPDWGPILTLHVEAQSVEGKVGTQDSPLSLLSPANPSRTAHELEKSVQIQPIDPPSALRLHKGDRTVLSFKFSNPSEILQTIPYHFTASGGLALSDKATGKLSIPAGQSLIVNLRTTALQEGKAELKVTTAHTTQKWALTVLPNTDSARSDRVISLDGDYPKPIPSLPAFVGSSPVNGLAELLTALAHAHPFTTKELASSLQAIHATRDLLIAAGLAPPSLIDGLVQDWSQKLLTNQNPDGGFGPWKQDQPASTLTDTADALGALTTEEVPWARSKAIAWLQQQLANTWFNEQDRAARPAVYAALAEADALDMASLRYFSDTSAALDLPARADAQLAAAFHRKKDLDATAFWIEKMRAAHPDSLTPDSLATAPELLKALEETSALPSETLAALRQKAKDGMLSLTVGNVLVQTLKTQAPNLRILSPPIFPL